MKKIFSALNKGYENFSGVCNSGKALTFFGVGLLAFVIMVYAMTTASTVGWRAWFALGAIATVVTATFCAGNSRNFGMLVGTTSFYGALTAFAFFMPILIAWRIDVEAPAMLAVALLFASLTGWMVYAARNISREIKETPVMAWCCVVILGVATAFCLTYALNRAGVVADAIVDIIVSISGLIFGIAATVAFGAVSMIVIRALRMAENAWQKIAIIGVLLIMVSITVMIASAIANAWLGWDIPMTILEWGIIGGFAIAGSVTIGAGIRWLLEKAGIRFA